MCARIIIMGEDETMTEGGRRVSQLMCDPVRNLGLV